MASYYQPDWTAGTVTLTSGSTAFTVASADLVAIGVQPGDEIYHTATGRWLIIDSVTDSTHGVLAYACPADLAGAGLPLRIRFQPDGSRFAAAYLNALQKFKGGNLDALAGLTGAADTGFAFSGAGTMFTFSETDAGRALLGLTGANGKIPVFTDTGTAEARSIIGTVGQSGGIPTGALIERSSNAGGEYARFADGTQICTTAVDQSFTIDQGPTLGGAWYASNNINWTYPAAFIDGSYPVVVGGARSSPYITMLAQSQSGYLDTAVSLFLVAWGAIPASLYEYKLVAIGRWF